MTNKQPNFILKELEEQTKPKIKRRKKTINTRVERYERD